MRNKVLGSGLGVTRTSWQGAGGELQKPHGAPGPLQAQPVQAVGMELRAAGGRNKGPGGAQGFLLPGKGQPLRSDHSSLRCRQTCATALSHNTPRHLKSHIKQHRRSYRKEIPPWVGNHKSKSPSPSPPRWREVAGAGMRKDEDVSRMQRARVSLGTTGAQGRRAVPESPDSSRGAPGAALPPKPRSLGIGLYGALVGLCAENTFSLQVSNVTSEHIRHFGEINIATVVNIPGNRWGM